MIISMEEPASKKKEGKKSKKQEKREKKEGKVHKDVQNILSVARTNDDSSVSKRSAARAKYIQDNFLTHFVKKPSKRSALINRGYFIRRYTVESVVRAFIDEHKGECQVVSLGAGFDSLYFVIPKENRCKKHIEVDFEHVVKRKSDVIRHTEELKAELEDFRFGEDKEIFASNYELISADLCQFEEFKNKLMSRGLDDTVPTLFLAECVFTYMSNADSDRVIGWAASAFQKVVFVTYEQIRPYDAFGRTMRANLVARGSDLLGIEGYPSKEKQEERYRKLGYENVCVKTMLDFYEEIEDNERIRICSLEEFDETEEWWEKCSHYTVSVSSKNEFLPFVKQRSIPPPQASACLPAEWKEEEIQGTGRHAEGKRWGHSVCALNDGRMVFFGGYGGSARHERVNTVLVIDVLSKHSFNPAKVTGSAPSARVLHTACMMSDDAMLVYGGRSNPSNAFNDFHLLNCATWQWTKLDMVTTDPCPARYRHSMTRIPGTQFVVIFGGKKDWREMECDDFFLVDVTGRSCKKITVNSDTKPCGRVSHSALWFEGALYIYGGFNTKKSVLSDMWKIEFSEAFDSVISAKEMSLKSLPPRFSHAGLVFENKMLFFGGCDRSHENTVISVCPKDDTVSVMQTKSELYSRPQAVAVNNRIYVVGGGMLCFSFGSIFSESLIVFTHGGDFVKPLRASKTKPKAGATSSSSVAEKKEIPRVSNPSKETFAEYVTKIREPCIFENCDGVPKWNKEDILASVPSSTLASVHVCDSPLLDFSNKNFTFKVIPFDEMLKRLEDEKSYLYFRSLGSNARKDPSNMSETFPKLAEQFLVPELCQDIVTKDNTHSSCLRFSSADIQMWTHYDINDNVLVGLKGTKRLMLFHPNEVKHLYAEGTASAVIDVDKPDLERFPKFAKAVQWTGTLKEGDVLFIPAMWWHNVRTLSPCYGLNIFFRHLEQQQYQANDLYGNKDPQSAVNAQKALQKVLDSLSELPKDYKEFYANKMILEMKKFIGDNDSF